MSAAKAKVRRRHRYCSVCEEEVAMSVIRQAEDENDLWWLVCPTCNSKFALTNQEYRKRNHRGTAAIETDGARKYKTSQIYSVGELIYHPKLDDMGVVLGKFSLPSVDCSGSIAVSFMEVGPKKLIEGYTKP